jgi:hypothetical protein
MKQKLLILLLVLSFLKVNAQLCPVATDNNPILAPCLNNLPTMPPYSCVWDWRPDTYHVFLHNETTGLDEWKSITSPFYSSSNRNTSFLSVAGPAPDFNDLRDYQPEDGWVLVKSKLRGDISTVGVNNPMVVLYNKYNATLRVFVCISNRKEDYNGCIISVKMVNLGFVDSKHLGGSALMAFANPVASPLDNFTAKPEFKKTNLWVNEANYWLFADFPMAYDPCTCNYSSALQVSAQLIKSGNLTFQMNQVRETPIVNAKVNDNSYSNASEFTQINGAIQSGLKTYTNTQNAVNSVKNAFGSINKQIEQNDLNLPSLSLPSWVTSVVPGLGAVIGFFDFFSGGGTSKQVSPIMSTLDFKASGTLEFSNPFAFDKFINPGSQKSLADQNTLPVYNNVMGIFNILETPVVEYITYQPNVPQVWYVRYGGEHHPYIYNIPSVSEYRLKNDIKFVLNPASDLELVKIQSTFVYNTNDSVRSPTPSSYDDQKTIYTKGNKYLYGPVELNLGTDVPSYNLPYKDRLARSGVEINKDNDIDTEDIFKIKYNTPYVDLQCMRNVTFKMFNSNNPPTIRLKLVLTLRPKNKPNAKEVVLSLTYPTEIVESIDNNSSRKYYFKILKKTIDSICHCLFCIGSSCFHDEEQNYYRSYLPWAVSGFPISNFDQSPWSNINELLYLDGELCGNYISNKIIVGNGAYIKSGCSIALKGNTVEINPNISLEGEVSIEQNNGTLSQCVNTPLISASSTDITKLCNNTMSTKYNKYSKNSELSYLERRALDSSEEIEEKQLANPKLTSQLKAIPNPATGATTFYFNISDESTTVELYLTDIVGKKVANVLLPQTRTQGTYQESFDISNLAQGIYLFTLQTSTSKETQRLVVE